MEISDYIVHFVEDEEVVRNSLAFLLTKAGFTVRVHDSATAFLSVAPSIRNGCLVTDLRMPDLSGVEFLKRLRELPVRIPSIVITGHGDVPMAVEAMRAGAIDFIEKPSAHCPDRRDSSTPRPNSLRLLPAWMSAWPCVLPPLSERERQVLKGVVAGQPNKTIAHRARNFSPRTVEVYRAGLMGKMQARSLPELVRMALAAGIGPR